MEPPTTGKISIETTKGSLEIELWCKQCPITCLKLIEKVRNGDLVGLKLVKNSDVRIAVNVNSKDKNPRVIFKRGYVGVDDDLVFGMDDGWNGLVIGKLVGESIYVLEKIDDEFDCVVKSSLVIVPYFDLEDKVEEKDKEEVKVKEEKPKKRKINLGYEEEDDGFEMKSSYELMPKRKKEVVKIENKEAEEVIPTIQATSETKETGSEAQTETQAQSEEDKSKEEEPTEPKEPEKKEAQPGTDTPTQSKESKESEIIELSQITEESLSSHPDLNYPFDKYKDIPIDIIRNHKYRI